MSVSVLASVAAHLIDRWAAHQLLRSQPRSTSTNNMESSVDEESEGYSSSSVLQDDDDSFERRCQAKFPFNILAYLLLVSDDIWVDRTFIDNASGLMLGRNLFVEPPNDCRLKHPEQCPSGYLSPVAGNAQIDGNNMSCSESISFIS